MILNTQGSHKCHGRCICIFSCNYHCCFWFQLHESSSRSRPLRLPPIHGLVNGIEASTWSKRAWTYQEGLISWRQLVFTDQEVFFICVEDLFAESCTEPPGGASQLVPYSRLQSLTIPTLKELPGSSKNIQTSLNNSYHTISLMSLTDSTLSKGWNVECRVALKLDSPRDCLSARFTRRSFGRSLIHRPRALRAQTCLPGPREAGSKHYVISIHLIWLT